LRRDTKNTTLSRFISVLIAGPLLAVGFVKLFTQINSRACESMFEFVAKLFGIGFEGMLITIVVTMMPIALMFSIIIWFMLRRWGPLRESTESDVSAE